MKLSLCFLLLLSTGQFTFCHINVSSFIILLLILLLLLLLFLIIIILLIFVVSSLLYFNLIQVFYLNTSM